MAKKTWNEPIDKNVDWGGDENTGGLPVSGAMVQKFIKESLDGKAGLFYYDTANNRYIVFADEIARDIYLEDPTRTDLIIGTFDAPFNYSAEIHLETPSYNAIFFGATGNYIDFTYDVKNKQGASTGESVIITITFVRNSIKKTITQVGRPNERVHFNVDGFIDEGTNTIIIGVTGQTTLAATTVSVTYQVVNLQLSDSLDISKVYDLSSSPQIMEVPFSVSGYGTKVVEWYLDGALLPFVKNEDEVVEVSTERTKYIELSNLQQGRHSLQIRAYTTINGEKFYTNTLYRDIIIYTGVSTATILAAAAEIPHQYGILESLILYGITQYIPYNLRFASYSPLNKQSVQVDITLDGDLKGQVSSQNGLENSFTFVTTTFGNKTLVLNEQDDTYTIPVLVNKTSMSIEEITTALKLDFSAVGRSNNSTDKGVWEYGDYVGTFKGFNWNLTSGWVDNRLKMNAGSSFEIDYAPLSGNPTSTGKTIEIEFKTTNVNNDDTIICDLRNSSGTGILIRATKASLISANGVVVETEFKAEEMVRIGFVINKTSGTTRKCMSFLYANGCISRGVEWASTDNYASEALIKFEASTGAEVELKSLRIYDTALSDDQILNNYTLYRDSIADMMDVYDRNNIYIDGTNSFSPDKAASRLPVMIVTGDIPTLENTSDTGTQIVVDIEYTNLQHPDKSFKMVGAAMRPQGTSSMGYPKKNFRIYTQKVDDTILYDSAGKVVPDKLYAFKDGAIPVNCWCLKADYAESSGTHNTGIARLWNEALFNMQVDGQYVCRTDAQKAAIENGYEYDVRTTIDGFPILLFYRPTANDEPIFIGKYNFNNDKSTEGVFGFTDIPGFNNEKMQCWEIRNNGNPLALFQTVDGFDSGWAEAYESRYPDTKTPYLGDLKAFSQWMVGVNGDHERFATEKWEHFKIYPMAAYYVYLMRHAAADQLAKNAMLTSEDGQHFYFIQYDNDTINGLNNLGEIDIPPTADRQSKDESGEYLFAAHESVLWNMLEADTEFMEIVKVVDNALYSAGISYANLIKVFDEEQSDKWVERVYNQDTEYKYIGPYVNQGINHLKKLQGKRDLHRRWWLSKRFSIYDAKFVSGEYKSQAIELKCKNDTPAGQQFTIRSGYKLDYGYGINAGSRVTGITLDVGDYHTFTTGEVVNLGDPIRIYGSANIAELDLSAMANRLAVVTISYVYDEELGTKFKKLVLGGTDVDNIDVTEISGLKQAKRLEYLDIQGMKGITSLDLTSQPYLQTLKAYNSGIKSVEFAKGANITALELPSTMATLILEQLPYLTYNKIVSEDNFITLKKIEVRGCPKISNSFDWIYDWYSSKTYGDEECSVIMDNVDWKGVNADKLVALTNLGALNLKGKVTLEGITLGQLNTLMDVFGESAFDKNADFFINAPDAIFATGRTELLEGESEDYNCVVFGGEVKRITWSIYSGGNSYTSINPDTGVLTTNEGVGNRTLVIRTVAVTDSGTKSVDTTVTIRARIYPGSSQTSISGPSRLEETRHTYRLTYSVEGITGDMTAVWSLSGMEGYAEIESYNDTSCVLKKVADTTSLIQGTLSCNLRKRYNNSSLFTISKNIELVNEDIAETDVGIVTSLYNAGLCANPAYITKEEAAIVTSVDLQPGTTQQSSIFYAQRNNIKSFDGFKHFTAVTALPQYTIISWPYCTSMILPETLVEVGNYNFRSMMRGLTLDISKVRNIGYACFQYVSFDEVCLQQDMTCGQSCFDTCTIGKLSVHLEECLGFYSCTIGTFDSLEGVKNLKGAFWDSEILDGKVLLPSTLENWSSDQNGRYPFGFFTRAINIEFTIPESNNYFKTIDGVLYSKDGKKLVCLHKKADYFEVPTYVETLGGNSLLGDIKELKISVPVIPWGASGEKLLSEKLILGEGVENINPRGFQNTKNLKELVIPSTLKVISYENFASLGYYEEIEELVFPEGFTSIGGFDGAKINRMVFPSTLTGEASIDANVKEVVFNPACTITSLNMDTCIRLRSIPEVPATCTSLDIRSVGEMENMVIPEGVEIVNLMLHDSNQLKTLDIPSTITLGYLYLQKAKQLHTITSRATMGIWNSCTFKSGSLCAGSNGASQGTNVIYVPQNAIGYDSDKWAPLYSAECGFTLSKTLPEGSLPDIAETDAGICAALYSKGLCKNNQYITKEEAALITAEQLQPGTTEQTSIFYNQRYNIKSFDGFQYFTSITHVPNNCFNGSNKLTSIILPPNVTYLDKFCFGSCEQLSSVILPEGVTSLGVCSFSSCKYGLKSITLPTSLISIDNECFATCSNLASIILPANLVSIGSRCFNRCLKLTSITSLALTAPTVNSETFGSTDNSYTGRNTYSTGENTLYVPAGATGYNTGAWLSPLQNAEKCGFTLSATL